MPEAFSGRGMASLKATQRRARFKLALAQRLRANPTDAERKLWGLLRAKQLGGLRFRRQQPIGPYIADFFSPCCEVDRR